MNKFLINIIVAIVWGGLTGEFTLGNLVIGFIIGYLILLLSIPLTGSSDYAVNFWRALGLAVYFVIELVSSSLRVSKEILRPKLDLKAGVIGIPLEAAETDLEITLLANIITVTPGTLSLDISDDRRTLYVHSMYITSDKEALRSQIKNGYEKQILLLIKHIL
ncbi:MAG TPA: Na+/H+ antiporter subunit E [Balneolaceae bacterium]|nr:Na+/H+ antiporter subunit E [Balneolaceae bacterium]